MKWSLIWLQKEWISTPLHYTGRGLLCENVTVALIRNLSEWGTHIADTSRLVWYYMDSFLESLVWFISSRLTNEIQFTLVCMVYLQTVLTLWKYCCLIIEIAYNVLIRKWLGRFHLSIFSDVGFTRAEYATSLLQNDISSKHKLYPNVCWLHVLLIRNGRMSVFGCVSS